MIRYIVIATMAAAGIVFFDQPNAVEPAPMEVKKQIRLTTRHLPIHRYFLEEDEDEELYVANHAMLVRRDFALGIQPEADIDTAVPDHIQLRLLLIRELAMKKYQAAWG